MTLIWPLHPRTKKRLVEYDIFNKVANHPGIILLEPLGYLEMLRLNMDARIMLTDSGGLQESVPSWELPCLTLRKNTERPITLKENGGVSLLVGNSVEKIRSGFREALKFSRTS